MFELAVEPELKNQIWESQYCILPIIPIPMEGYWCCFQPFYFSVAISLPHPPKSKQRLFEFRASMVKWSLWLNGSDSNSKNPSHSSVMANARTHSLDSIKINNFLGSEFLGEKIWNNKFSRQCRLWEALPLCHVAQWYEIKVRHDSWVSNNILLHRRPSFLPTLHTLRRCRVRFSLPYSLLSRIPFLAANPFRIRNTFITDLTVRHTQYQLMLLLSTWIQCPTPVWPPLWF